MGKKEVLPLTKAESAEQRLEELVRNKTLTRCWLLTAENKDYEMCIESGEFRNYPDGFEAIGAYDSSITGILYSKGKNMMFYYDFRKENELQDILSGRKSDGKN